MASKYKYTGFNGMDEFIDAVDTIQREAPGRLVKELRREARQVVNSYKKRVKPHAINHNLEKAIEFRKNDVYIQNGEYEAEIYSNSRKAPHFHLVEYGHKQTKAAEWGGRLHAIGEGGKREPGLGSLKRGGVKVSRVYGKRYWRDIIEQESPRLQASRERYIERILKELM